MSRLESCHHYRHRHLTQQIADCSRGRHAATAPAWTYITCVHTRRTYNMSSRVAMAQHRQVQSSPLLVLSLSLRQPGSQAARQPGNWDCGLLWSYRHAPPRPKAVRFPPAIARVLPTLVSQLPSAPSHQSHAAAGAAPSDAAHPLPSPPAFRRISTLPPNLLLLLLLLLPGQTDPHRHYYHHRHQQLPLPLCLKSADSPGQA